MDNAGLYWFVLTPTAITIGLFRDGVNGALWLLVDHGSDLVVPHPWAVGNVPGLMYYNIVIQAEVLNAGLSGRL